MSAMASQITGFSMVCEARIKWNINGPHHWPVWVEFSDDREFPSQRACKVENVSIWRRHHVKDVSHRMSYYNSWCSRQLLIPAFIPYVHFILPIGAGCAIHKLAKYVLLHCFIFFYARRRYMQYDQLSTTSPEVLVQPSASVCSSNQFPINLCPI